MKKIKQLLVTITLFLLCLAQTPQLVFATVSGSATSEKDIAKVEEPKESQEGKSDVNMTEVVEIFSLGIGCGIIFSLLPFVLSLLINLFFDIARKC